MLPASSRKSAPYFEEGLLIIRHENTKETIMARRYRTRERLFWSHWGCHRMYPPYWGPWGPPPWWLEEPTAEEEKADLQEHIAILKEELSTSEKRLKELEKTS
jgi:hypothetical protein